MNCLYHRVRPNLEGNILYPLNELKIVKPHIYEKAVQKYKGRETLLTRKIPILDCLWNDVLHFSPLHPAKIFAKFDEMIGGKFLEKPLQFFEVNPTAMGFNAENAVIYLHTPREKGDFTLPESDFLPFNAELLADYQEIPEATITHYKETVPYKKQVWLYLFVPHILYRGSLEVEKLKVIEVY